MAAPTSAYKDRQFLAVIGDEVEPHFLALFPIILTYISGFGNRSTFSRRWRKPKPLYTPRPS